MKTKKNHSANLESKRSLFFQLGLVFALALTITAFQWKSGANTGNNQNSLTVSAIDEEIIPITKPEKALPPPPVPVQTFVPVNDKTEIPDEKKPDETEIDENTKLIVITPIKEKEPEEISIFRIVERMPTFKGCDQPGNEEKRGSCSYNKIQDFLASTIRYPEMASRNGISGIVHVTFIIDPDGNVRNAEILRGIGGGCDEEALRSVMNMPRWTPGQQRGKNVAVQYNLPVNFVLKK
jgi:periplasmic protein TonB